MYFELIWVYWKLFLWVGILKRLCELIANDKKFCILYFGPSFLWQVFRQVRVLEWERRIHIIHLHIQAYNFDARLQVR
jgi:hypothetical protein